MALVKPETKIAEETVAETETVEETVVETKTKTEDKQEMKQETKEVAVKEEAGELSTEVKVVGGVFAQNQQILDIVADMDYGDFQVVKASNGGMKCDKDKLGSTLKIIAHAAVSKEVFSTGSTDEEAKEMFDVCYNGETCERSGDTKEAHKQMAIESGYDKAAWKKYIDLLATIVECPGNEDYEGEQLIFQLSPSSCKPWKTMANKIRTKAALGLLKVETAPVIEVTAVEEEYAGNDWTRFGFRIPK